MITLNGEVKNMLYLRVQMDTCIGGRHPSPLPPIFSPPFLFKCKFLSSCPFIPSEKPKGLIHKTVLQPKLSLPHQILQVGYIFEVSLD
ncbi:uncharacterized protein LOC131004396 isoform X2 [Salvia miltiorrhiza]|uniref:uncharacterized protein LOC131004396 isoform X2 n=1 Tax=Salvia miltiorrhiza TaxID=226208 RepID=UPI0025AB6D11|nr:uncharacterized protein LOC131004396 isoform X2 [Salvia miltiorrhiza]